MFKYVIPALMLISCAEQRSYSGIEISSGTHNEVDVLTCLDYFYQDAGKEFPNIKEDLEDYGVGIFFDPPPLECRGSGCASPSGHIQIWDTVTLCDSGCGILAHELYHITAWMYGLSTFHKDHQGTWWGSPYEQTSQYRVQMEFTTNECNGNTEQWK